MRTLAADGHGWPHFVGVGLLRRAGSEAMRVKVGGDGREQYGAWREGTHDDLVFAVALACWVARKMNPHEPAGGEAGGSSSEWRP